ncbi:MAG TPA: histidine phosphatase family protein [Gemmatimonadaceae bacterium]|nr:histidine phosphatase family protein [Gemmatimonadaceae bacterium]
MYVLIVRHGQAGSREEFARTGQPDDLRPLTESGARKIHRIARGLRRIVPRIDVLATSPLTRARQTAEILGEAYGIDPVDANELVPDASFAQFARWAKSIDASQLAIVGHEPHLSALVAWLVSKDGSASLVLKKGGACMIEFDGAPRRGTGALRWLMTPGALRRL